MKLNRHFLGCIVLLLIGASTSFAADDPLHETFYVPFENNSPDAVIARGEPKTIGAVIDKYEDGPVGKSARSDHKYNGIRWEGRGNIDLDRGTMAFFYKRNEDVVEREWESLGGVTTDMDGYWGSVLDFQQIDDTFNLQLFDEGRYTRRVYFPKIIGRWKKEQWVHLATVWDRNEGIKIYEDGKLVDSNWGKYHWERNYVPRVLHLGANMYAYTPFSGDELHVYAECLTDNQIAQLAKGEKPTGDPIAITPQEKRRDNDLTRMGWLPDDLKQIHAVKSGQPAQYTFARVIRGIDAKRQVAQPFEGLPDSAWPLTKYGASLSGRLLELDFAPSQQFDRIRVLAQRPTKGVFAELDPVSGMKPIVSVDSPHSFWRTTLAKPHSDAAILFQREAGSIGQIDFYSVADAAQLPAKLTPYTTSEKLPKIPPTQAGLAVMGDTPFRFENAVHASAKGGAKAFDLASPAFGGVQIITDTLGDAIALDGVVVKLVLAKAIEKPTPVQIVVKEPIWLQRDWLVADAVLQPGGGNEYAFVLKGRSVVTPISSTKVKRGDRTIDQPPIELAALVTAGEPITWRMGDGGTSVSLIGAADEKAAKAISIADQIEYAREAFAESNEGHIWDGHPKEMWGRLYHPVLYLMGMAPTERPVMQLATRVYWRTEPLPYVEPSNIARAPEWAFWQLEALKCQKKILHWIIDNHQLPNGEFGGVWGDDTDLVENWPDFALMGDDDRHITKSLRKIYAGVYRENLVQGVSASVRDCLHAYEEGMGTIANQLVVDYGDPVAIEHTMVASSHYPEWMKKNDDGSYSFRSSYWGASGVWDHGDFAKDNGPNGLAFVPAAYLIWYNHHPAPQPYLKGWNRNLEGFGLVPDTLYELMSEPERDAFRKGYYTEQAEKLIKGGNYAMTANAVLDEIGVKEEWRQPMKALGRYAQVQATSQMSLHMTEAYASLYKATGDVKYLTNSYIDCCKMINNLDWTYTEANPSTDRIPLPHSTLSRARLGSMAVNRAGNGDFWPRHGLSYWAGGDDVAALVMDNSYTSLSARFWSFPETEHTMTVRVWRLWPGKYKLTLAKDANDDGTSEETIWSEERSLVRGSMIDLKLPPRLGVVLKITAIDAKPMNFDKPDPAIGEQDVAIEYASGHLQVTVHNVGTKPVDNVLVRVRDLSSGAIVAEQTLDHLDAPLDLKARTKRMEFHNIDCITDGGLSVELDPDGKIDDLNPFNNKVEYRY